MIELLGLAVLGFMIAEWFQPIQWLKDQWRVYEWPLIGKHLYCVKCTSFWLALFVTQSLYYAAIVSIFGYTIKFIVDKIEDYYHGN
jgi:hypothetical protein